MPQPVLNSKWYATTYPCLNATERTHSQVKRAFVNSCQLWKERNVPDQSLDESLDQSNFAVVFHAQQTVTHCRCQLSKKTHLRSRLWRCRTWNMRENKTEGGSYVLVYMLAAVVITKSGRLKSETGHFFKWSHSESKPHESQRHVRNLRD